MKFTPRGRNKCHRESSISSGQVQCQSFTHKKLIFKSILELGIVGKGLHMTFLQIFPMTCDPLKINRQFLFVCFNFDTGYDCLLTSKHACRINSLVCTGYSLLSMFINKTINKSISTITRGQIMVQSRSCHMESLLWNITEGLKRCSTAWCSRAGALGSDGLGVKPSPVDCRIISNFLIS